MTGKIEVEILVAPGCTSRVTTEALVAKGLEEIATTAHIITTVITTASQARIAKFLGSPSVRVNGFDVEPDARSRKEYGLG